MDIKSEYSKIAPYITKDGSEIRELVHPDRFGPVGLSLAEATVGAGLETALHRHVKSEEIYHIQAGEGIMTWGEESFAVRKGDSIFIPSGTPHKIRNTGKDFLRILCCCAPAYSHEDTQLIE